MPKVSIIVPIYNSEIHLSRCIDSILAQTYTDFEIIIVDDGSSDNTEETIKNKYSNYPNITYCKNEI